MTRQSCKFCAILEQSIVICLVVLSLVLVGQNHSTAQTKDLPPRVEIPGSQLLHVTSQIVGREYDIDVQLPGNYGDTTRVYPVIYHLDAQWDFPLVQALYGQQYYDGFIPAAIIVGITWGGPHPNYDSLRAMDLSPSYNKQKPHSGNGPKFLAFIKDELIPLIDARYRTDRKDRTLMGSSFGGLFTLYALFEETTLFNRYILTSPYVEWDNHAIKTFEKDFEQKGGQTPVRVFIAHGGMEPESGDIAGYVNHLRSLKLPGLELETSVIVGAGHSGGKAEGFTRGLQSVFRRPSLKLSSAVLDQYVGKYQVGPNSTISLKQHDGQLVGVSPDGEETLLLAQSEKDFYVPGRFMNVHFKTDSQNVVTGFLLEQYAWQGFIRKVQ